jgi:glucose-6-phosphate 1-dehydrogenase
MKLFIFGSTGDLVKRKIIPAFLELRVDDLEIIALGRKDFTQEEYHRFVCDGGDCFKDFKNKPKYEKANFESGFICENCGQFLDSDSINYFYSAMPPKNIVDILKYLSNIKKQGYKIRALIEKPFGENLKDAISLKELAEKEGIIDDIFVSDHYLFKDEIIPIKKKKFKKLKIVSLEKVGLEKRIGYYDDIGALKDMVQSHLLNISFRFLKNPEKEFEDFEVVSLERGQYKSYRKELGKKSNTETFVSVSIKTKERFYEFITGKKFDKKLAFFEVDGEKIEMVSERNSYATLFLNFFSDKKDNFASIDDIILAWKIIEKIEHKKTELISYKDGSDAGDYC